MEKCVVVEKTLRLYLEGKTKDAIEFAKHYYPYEDIRKRPNPVGNNKGGKRVKSVPIDQRGKRPNTEYQKIQVFINDCYTDRYSGEKLIFHGAIRILREELPTAFPILDNFRMKGTHPIYWELSPSLDHIIPISRLKLGEDCNTNWITTCDYTNYKKGSKSIEQANLTIVDKQRGWDGLSELFLEIVEKKPYLLDKSYIKKWKNALLRAKREGIV